jgi:hypothetical protein
MTVTMQGGIHMFLDRAYARAARGRLLSAVLVIATLLLASAPASAQLTGTRNVPGDYADLAAAITDLNTQGVGAGGVILNLVAANPQVAPPGGYRIATTTSSPANPITVQGNGNTVTASAAHTVGALNDAVFKIVGSDNVTITGFTLLENPANTVTAAATNTMTEWGIALLYASVTDGAQNATIQANTIDLDRTYQNTFAIYANATHSETAPTTSASATGPTGGHSGLRVYGNTITDTNIGIVFVGPTAAADQDATVDIGGTSAATGNTVTNYGTTGTFSSYANVSGTVNGILVRNVRNANVSRNSVASSNGGTTAGTLRGIYVVVGSTPPTGASAHTIDNNVISVRSGAATGGMTAVQVDSGASTVTGSVSITNNDFRNSGHTVAASGGVTFISVGGSATAGPLGTTINGNTFTNLTLNTTGNATLISNNFTRPANGTTTVNNNAIVTQFSKTGAGGTVRGYDNFGSSPATVAETNTGNTFSNITLAAGATALELWRSADGAAAGGSRKTITGNTFNNISNAGTGATTILIGSFSDSTFAGNTVSGNTVSNVTAGGTLIGISSTSQSQNLSGNIVHSLTGSGTGAVTGISVSGGISQVVSANRIYSLENSNAGGAVFGITVSVGTTVDVINNLVGDLRGPNLNAGNSLIGLNFTGGTTINASYNTVRLAATSGGALFGSSALSASTTPTLTLRNNVLVNLSTANGGGISAAYRRSSATLTSYGAASNSNALFAGTPGPANVIYLDGTNTDQTLAAFRARVAPRDGASVSENPPFLSTSGASVDFLHINPAVATQLESGGVPVGGITTDFDGQARNATAPDIGADEFNGILLDLVPPSIGYGVLPNTTSTANRTLQATITDASGVAGGATAPRIYFRKNADPFQSAACTGTAPTYSCTIDYSAIGGAVVGDAIAYFVVAQDSAGNVGANPSGGFAATDVNNVTTPPTTPAGYAIVTAFAPTLNVGSGETITSLTNPGGLFAAINAGVLNANVVVSLTSDLSGETGAVALQPFTEEGAGGYTLTIRPAGAPRSITGAAAPSLIRLNGADRVIFDGSLTGGTAAAVVGGDAALRNLTISNTSTTTGIAVIQLASGADGARNVTLRNLNIIGQDPTLTLAGIVVGGATPGLVGADNDSVRIENNSIRRAIIGVYNAGANAANPNTGTVVTRNDLTGTAGDRLRRAGILLFNQDGAEVSLNAIGGIDSNESADSYGIGLGVQDANITQVGSGAITNSLVSRNRITGVVSASTTGFSAFGIGVSGGTTGANTIVNNMVSGVTAPSTAPDFPSGIFITGVPGSVTRVVHNSIALTGDRGTVATQAPGFGIAITGSNPTVELRNNVISNTQTTTGGGAGALAYAIGTASTAFTSLAANHNVYFAGGPTPGFFRSGSLAVGAGTNYATLAEWQTATGGDANAVFGDPLFTSASDLHLLSGSPAINAGSPQPTVTIDIDGDPRSATTPEIGADELVNPNTAPSITASPTTRTEGNAGAVSTIATATDTEDAETALAVTINGGASATVNGVTVGGIAIDANGAVTASVAAACLATSANFTLRATDTGGLFAEANLAVTVLPNVAPTLTYGAASLVAGTGTTVNPASGPSDSGTVQSIAVQSTGTYTGGATVAATGVVTLSNAGPVGGHTLVIRATDNCGAVTNANLGVTVTAVPTDADLSIVKTSSLSLGASGLIQYTLQVANAGPVGAIGAVVADTFPASLSNINWTCTPSGAGAACPATGSGNINAQVDLASGTSVVFAITAQLPASPPGAIANTATVAVPAGLTDPVPGNNSSSVTDTLGLFSNGFEPVTAPGLVLRFDPATPGQVQRIALPTDVILGAARGVTAAEAVSIVVGDSLAVVQVRRIGERAQLRLLQRDAGTSWAVGEWLDLTATARVGFEWSTQLDASQRVVLQARLQVGG